MPYCDTNMLAPGLRTDQVQVMAADQAQVILRIDLSAGVAGPMTVSFTFARTAMGIPIDTAGPGLHSTAPAALLAIAATAVLFGLRLQVYVMGRRELDS